MNVSQIVSDLSARVDALGSSISIVELCRRAEIAPMTFRRWRNGAVKPQLGKLEKFEAVLTRAEAAKRVMDDVPEAV